MLNSFVLLQRNGFPENRQTKNGKIYRATREYVALCTNLHGIGHDKATYAAQNKDKRYIIGIMSQRLKPDFGLRRTLCCIEANIWS
jgi:hypothetical protein